MALLPLASPLTAKDKKVASRDYLFCTHTQQGKTAHWNMNLGSDLQCTMLSRHHPHELDQSLPHGAANQFPRRGCEGISLGAVWANLEHPLTDIPARIL